MTVEKCTSRAARECCLPNVCLDFKWLASPSSAAGLRIACNADPNDPRAIALTLPLPNVSLG
jgi:hypothetical protein